MSTNAQALTPTVIKPPDTSVLPQLNFDAMMALRVTDDATEALAVTHAKAAKDYTAKVEALFKEPVESANRVHKFLTGLRSTFTSKSFSVEDHARLEITAYQRKKEEERAALERRLREQAEREARAKAEAEQQARLEEARKVAADAERQRQAEIDELMPWEQETAAQESAAKVEAAMAAVEEIAATPVPVLVPEIVVPRSTPATEGLGTRKGPLKYRVKDFQALVKSAAVNPALVDYLQVNDAMVKGKMKTVGEKLGDFIPGLETYRDDGIVIR